MMTILILGRVNVDAAEFDTSMVFDHIAWLQPRSWKKLRESHINHAVMDEAKKLTY
jgi:hypothetical protein